MIKLKTNLEAIDVEMAKLNDNLLRFSEVNAKIMNRSETLFSDLDASLESLKESNKALQEAMKRNKETTARLKKLMTEVSRLN